MINNESEPLACSERLACSGEVLIKVAGGAMIALCAEPAIRSFKIKSGSDVRITVCGEGCDILRNHGDIDNVVLSSDRVVGEFDVVFELSDLGCNESVSDLMERFAVQLGVDVSGETPMVSLDSFDHVRCLKFGISKMKHPRVAICTGSGADPAAWDESKWDQLCSILEDTLDSQIIQVGAADNKYLGHGVDLIGRTSERESAALLSRTDLLVSSDENHALLARAAGTPCVLVSECKEAVGTESCISAIDGNGEPCEVSVVCVIDSIVDLCGNNSDS